MADVHTWLLAAIATVVVVEMLVLNHQRRRSLCRFLTRPISQPTLGTTAVSVVGDCSVASREWVEEERTENVEDEAIASSEDQAVAGWPNGSTCPTDSADLVIERLTLEGEWVEGSGGNDVDEEDAAGSEQDTTTWGRLRLVA